MDPIRVWSQGAQASSATTLLPAMYNGHIVREPEVRDACEQDWRYFDCGSLNTGRGDRDLIVPSGSMAALPPRSVRTRGVSAVDALRGAQRLGRETGAAFGADEATACDLEP